MMDGSTGGGASSGVVGGVRGRVCIAIDLKSFYASVECVDRGLDPLTTHLVVADETRTDKTICLAVSPSLKEYGLPGRPRLFEAKERLRQVNAERALAAPGRLLLGESCDADDLAHTPRLKASMVIAPPRMAKYLAVSGRIYGIYLKYAAPEHIHVYSIDEVFIEATPYLRALGMTAHEMAMTIVRDILSETGITATAGIGTNLYLAKVAMDIVAKHMPADEDGVRVAELDEMSYRRLLWGHRPLTDFWRVGRGYARRLEKAGLMTMGDIARCSIGRASDYYNEELLYRMFGVNAELLIDHAWGWEPCAIADIKAYEPDAHSASIGQVLTGPVDHTGARLIVKEMADTLALELVDKQVVTDRLTLAVGYDVGSLDPRRLDSCADDALKRTARIAARSWDGPVAVDHYGRKVPKPSVGSIGLDGRTALSARLRGAMAVLFDRIADPALLVRRITVVADDLTSAAGGDAAGYEQPDLFAVVPDAAAGAPVMAEGGAGRPSDGVKEVADGDTDGGANGAGRAGGDDGVVRSVDRNAAMDRALLEVKRRFGRNAAVRAMNMEPGATGMERNNQIGGHRR